MPKKTKKEKIIALYRKKLKLLQGQPAEEIENISARETPKPVYQTETKTVSQEEVTTISYFFADFKKSLILIVLIIALEISLYFATINNYLKF